MRYDLACGQAATWIYLVRSALLLLGLVLVLGVAVCVVLRSLPESPTEPQSGVDRARIGLILLVRKEPAPSTGMIYFVLGGRL